MDAGNQQILACADPSDEAGDGFEDMFAAIAPAELQVNDF